LRASTVNLLACPACRGDLLLRKRLAHRGEVLEGSLVCSRCGAEYEISNGIPRLLPSPARRRACLPVPQPMSSTRPLGPVSITQASSTRLM